MIYVMYGTAWKISTLGAFGHGLHIWPPHLIKLYQIQFPLIPSEFSQLFQGGEGVVLCDFEAMHDVWEPVDLLFVGCLSDPNGSEDEDDGSLVLRFGMYWQNWLARRVISNMFDFLRLFGHQNEVFIFLDLF